MLKRILIGIDGTVAGQAAMSLGVQWADAHQAMVVGLGIVDKPGIAIAESSAFGEHSPPLVTDSALSDARLRVDEALVDLAHRCNTMGVACRTLMHVGEPSVGILRQASAADLLVMGRPAPSESGKPSRVREALEQVIKRSPRPVVAVPAGPIGGDPVIVAYDGSLQASRTLWAFAATGLGRSRTVHVLSVAASRDTMAPHVEQAMEFLLAHDINAEALVVESARPPAAAILEEAGRVKAGLIVMGTFGQSVVKEYLLGSVTRSVLTESPVPVFCFH